MFGLLDALILNPLGFGSGAPAAPNDAMMFMSDPRFNRMLSPVHAEPQITRQGGGVVRSGDTTQTAAGGGGDPFEMFKAAQQQRAMEQAQLDQMMAEENARVMSQVGPPIQFQPASQMLGMGRMQPQQLQQLFSALRQFGAMGR